MGAWGYGAWDNDSALDWKADMEDSLIATIKPWDEDFNVRIAIADFLLSETNNNVPRETLAASLAALRDIPAGYYDDWSDPAARRAIVRSLVVALETKHGTTPPVVH